MLSATTILSAWEAGHGKTPPGRALAMLRAEDRRSGNLESLTAGELEMAILGLRERAFGPLLECRCECPVCSTRLEFTVAIENLRGLPPAGRSEISLALPGWSLRFRTPRAEDLVAASKASDVAAAQAVLLERCLIEARVGEAAVGAAHLPDVVRESISAAMAEADPQGDLQLDLRCAACEHQWLEPLDVGAFLWSELAAEGRRLLAQVDVLARSYGWTEAEVLALSPWRRERYLELVDA